jgi:hypothetical protein
MQMTTAAAAGNNVTLRFAGAGTATFQGVLDSKGGTGVLNVNTSAYCPADVAAGSLPISYGMPIRMESAN